MDRNAARMAMRGVPERLGLRFADGNIEMRARPNGTAAGSNFEWTGYATVYDAPFDMWDQNGEPFTETVAPGAAKRSLARPDLDVPFLVGHNEQGIPMARTKSGTMRLSEDSHGLLVQVPSMDGRREDVRALASAVERGDMTEMSLAFVCNQQQWDRSYEHRTVLEMDLHRGDVCAVTHGANPATAGASMRAVEQLTQRRPAVISGQRKAVTATERLSQPRTGGSMTERRRLSAHIGGIADTRRRSTVDEFRDMQREAEQLEARAARADDLERRLTVFEPDIYGPASPHSYFADIARVTRQQGDGDGGVKAAEKRLADSDRYEHRKTDRRLRQLIAERELERELTGSAEEYITFERWKAAGGKLFEKHDELRGLERLAASTTPGSGGYFVPPAWLDDLWSHSPRAGAPMAALWTQLPLPLHQGDTINVPRLAAGSGAGTTTQAGDGAPVAFRDPLDGTVQAKVETLAATLDASMELMDMSPLPFDESWGRDISEDFATQADGQLLLGNGANGTLNGVIPAGAFSSSTMLLLESTNNSSSQTWVNGGTDITSSVHRMLSMLYSRFARYRGLPATHWVVNPDVWGILCGSADGNNRPLVEPGRLVKALHGLPLVEDSNLISSFGGTTPPAIGVSAGVSSPTPGNGTWSPVLLGRWSDLFWFAAPPVIQVLPQVLSGTFQVRYRVSRYVASMPNRVVWGGTGQTFSGTDQAGGLDNGAAVGYSAFTNFTSNSPLQPVANGW